MIDENGNIVLIDGTEEKTEAKKIDIDIRILADLIVIATEKPIREFVADGHTLKGCRAYLREHSEGVEIGSPVLDLIREYAKTDPKAEAEEKAKREAEAAARKAEREVRKAKREAEINAFFGIN